MATVETMGTTLLLTLREAAPIIGVDYRKLRLWVHDQIVSPEVRGLGGRGYSSMFTVSQVYGLVLAKWLWLERYPQMRRSLFVEEYERYASMSWSAIEHVLGLRDDDWSEKLS
jgi:hypothetical protein